MRISDWSSDVCSSDLRSLARRNAAEVFLGQSERLLRRHVAGDAEHSVVGPVVVAMERGHVLQAGGLQVLEAAVAVVVALPLVEGQLADVGPHEATIGLVFHVEPDLFLHHVTNGRAWCRERVWRYVYN